MKPTKIYQFMVPANGAFPLQVVGDFLKILESSAPIEVRGDSFGTIGEIEAGQGLRNCSFQRIEFRDGSGFDNWVRVLVGDADFVDDRISGVVEVLDGGKARTLSGSAKTGVAARVGVAAQKTRVQLFNQVGSGVLIVVEQVALATTSANGIYMGIGGVSLSTLQATGVSKISGGVNGVGQLRTDATAIAPVGPYCAAFIIPPNSTYTYKFTEPLVLMPGAGLMGWSTSDAVDVIATFEWFEESL